jgi:threonine/homoserine/homoserine lactone efflux protein
VLLAWPGAACLVWAVQAFRSGPARSAPAEQPDPALSSG